MKKAISVILGLFLSVITWADATATERKLIERHFRPGNAEEPTTIHFNAFVVDILNIDDVAGTMTIDYFLALRWRDDRLADAAFANPSDKLNLTIDDIWHPNIDSINMRDVSMMTNMLNIDSDGNVLHRKRGIATFTTPLDLRQFPFDHQTINLRFLSSVYTSNDLKCVWDPNRSGHMNDFSLSGWSFESFSGAAYIQTVQPLSGDSHDFVGLQLTFDLQRKPAFYIWKVFFPLGLIAFMAWTVFWIDPANFGGQIAISTSSVITLIAFQLSLSELLPRISYLTNIDVYAIGTSILVFIALGESILTARLAKIEKHNLSLGIDRHMRWAYPLVYGLLTLLVVL